MIDVDTFYKIKHLYHDGHLRVGQIAEQLHLDVETVSKWIQRDTYRRRTGPRRSNKLDAYKASIINLLQNRALSSAKILKILRTQGYTGGVSILTDFIRTKAPRLPISRREFLAYSWMHKAMQDATSSDEMYHDLNREFEPELVASLLREIKSGHYAIATRLLLSLSGKRGFQPESSRNFYQSMKRLFANGLRLLKKVAQAS